MKKIPIVILFIGCLAILVAVVAFVKQQQFLSGALLAEGQVVELLPTKSRTYKPVVHFTTENGELIEISSTSSSNPPAYKVGERVEVYYEALNPLGAEISGFFSLWGLSVILGGIGAAFGIIGAILLVMMSDKSKRLAKLKVSGTRVEAKLDQVYLNQSMQLNGQHPFQVYAKWSDPLSGQEYTFKSANLWFDPSEQLIQDYVSVFMERNNPKRYAMDLSFVKTPA